MLVRHVPVADNSQVGVFVRRKREIMRPLPLRAPPALSVDRQNGRTVSPIESFGALSPIRYQNAAEALA
ncbi:hypothetical protein ACFVIM_30835 [Streptomyces sp. NPDC057638]|uniref:hypothetical protein n=1 Tax=Streptomyces sp. NPDC057638 TaxID=3346190 RepID=UPI0036AFA729